MSVFNLQLSGFSNRILYEHCEEAFVLGDTYSEKQAMSEVSLPFVVSVHLLMLLMGIGYTVTDVGRISVGFKVSRLIPLVPALEPDERAYYVAIQVMVGETSHLAYSYVRRPVEVSPIGPKFNVSVNPETGLYTHRFVEPPLYRKLIDQTENKGENHVSD